MPLVRIFIAAGFMVAADGLLAQTPAAIKPYVSEDAPVLVLDHVRVIDGTGAVPAEDQRIDIEGGRIVRVQSAKLKNAYPARGEDSER